MCLRLWSYNKSYDTDNMVTTLVCREAIFNHSEPRLSISGVLVILSISLSMKLYNAIPEGIIIRCPKVFFRRKFTC